MKTRGRWNEKGSAAGCSGKLNEKRKNKKAGKGSSTAENTIKDFSARGYPIRCNTPGLQEQTHRVNTHKMVAFESGGTKSNSQSQSRKVLTCRDLSHGILSIEDVLMEHECRTMIEWGEAHGFEEVRQAEIDYYAFRSNGRISVEDALMAEAIYIRLQPFLPEVVDGMKPVGCSSEIQFYRYTVGQRFGKHTDAVFVNAAFGGVTKFTVLIYLNGAPEMSALERNDGCVDGVKEVGKRAESARSDLIENELLSQAREADGEQEVKEVEKVEREVVQEEEEEEETYPVVGGETVFHIGAYSREGASRVMAEVKPVRGRCLLHGHGEQCLTHESREVTRGIKYVLRTDVVYR